MIEIINISSHNLESFDQTHLDKALKSQESLTVNAYEDALKVVGKIREKNAKIVFVMDAGQLRGILDPRTVIEGYNYYKNRSFSSLEEALLEVEQDPKEQTRGFHHEYLNTAKVRLKYCPDADVFVEEYEPCP